MPFFSFTKLQNRRVEQVLLGWKERVGTSRKLEEEGKGPEKVNIVQILCAHVFKWKKIIPVETIPGTEERE
jgi:hypothetical protein